TLYATESGGRRSGWGGAGAGLTGQHSQNGEHGHSLTSSSPCWHGATGMCRSGCPQQTSKPPWQALSVSPALGQKYRSQTWSGPGSIASGSSTVSTVTG